MTDMTAPAITLAEFLLARLDEDEQTARAIEERDRRWELQETGSPEDGVEYSLDLGPGRDLMFVGYGEDLSRAEAEHIARHDPARVLARCEADRRIVELNARASDVVPAQVLRLLALPYADHPDYRDEWRP